MNWLSNWLIIRIKACILQSYSPISMISSSTFVGGLSTFFGGGDCNLSDFFSVWILILVGLTFLAKRALLKIISRAWRRRQFTLLNSIFLRRKSLDSQLHLQQESCQSRDQQLTYLICNVNRSLVTDELPLRRFDWASAATAWLTQFVDVL